MNKPQPILELKEVSRTFKQGGDTIIALEKTNFSAMPGELIAIIGPSGSGKSTFLTIAGGLLSPSKGRVFIDGTDITNLSNKQLSRIRFKYVGFILQASNLVPFLSMEKQLSLRDAVAKQHPKKSAKDKLFKQLGIQNLRKKYPSDLSGGERQRAAIAKVLYGEPKLVLADEPTASLDTKKAYEVVELLAKQTHGQDRATIMVTHDERLIKYCDKVYEMSDGVLTQRESHQKLQ